MVKYYLFKLVSKGRMRQLTVWFVVCVIIAAIISVIGNLLDLSWEQIIGTFLDPGTFGGDAGDAHPGFRLIVALLSIFFISSLLVSVISNVFSNISESVRSGGVHYNFPDFILIFGAGAQLKNILEEYKGKKTRVVVVSPTDPDIPGYRYTYYHGERDNEADLMRCRVHKAGKIFILGESNEPNHDTKNLICYGLVSQLAGKSKRPIKCYMTINDYSTAEIYQYSNMKTESVLDGDGKSMVMMVDVLNEYEFYAEQFLTGTDFLPVLKANDRQKAHIVILGSGNVAQSVAYTVAQLCHYPFLNGAPRKTRITILDPDAKKFFKLLKVSRPSLWDLSEYSIVSAGGETTRHIPSRELLDIEWNFVEYEPFSDEGRDCLTRISSDGEYASRIIVCYENDSDRAIDTALHLPSACFENSLVALYIESGSIIVDKASTTGMYCNYATFGPGSESVGQSVESRSIRGKRANFAYHKNESAKKGEIISFSEEVLTSFGINSRNRTSIPASIRQMPSL